jgi:hypothetical protein
MPYNDRIKARFWAKVSVCEHGKECPDCCWPWTGAMTSRGYKHGKGYGHIGYKEEGSFKNITGHRVAWELAHNKFIPEGLWCLHTCDNPPCCNPQHLWLGSQRDNIEDMRLKGRAAKGEEHHKSKLTVEQVMEIRALAKTGGHTLTDLGRRYGVSRSTIHEVVSGNNWGYIPGAGKMHSRRPHYRTKLTEQDVQIIRRLVATEQSTQAELARRFGVNRSSIHCAVTGKTWAHVTQESDSSVQEA